MTRPSARIERDEGSALVLVLGIMTTLIVLVTVALSAALQTQGVAQRSRHWNQALVAAQAGVDDYLARLNGNDNYWMSVDCANVALRKAWTTGTPPCGWDPSTTVGWVPIPGSEGTPYESAFHYDVITTKTPADGTIGLTVTGRSGPERRTIAVTLRRAGFGEFLYYTDFETIDPANEIVYPTTASQEAAYKNCAHYWWTPRNSTTGSKRGSGSCAEIQFAAGDVINGPLHSNDTMLISGGARFTGTATTSNPDCKPVKGKLAPIKDCYRATGSGSPTFDRGLTYRLPVELPETLNDLKQYVTPGMTTNLGCLYTGPTRIKFVAPVAGTPLMRVWSPWTKDPNPGCGTTAALRATGSAGGATVPLPDGKLVMVQNVPSGQVDPAGVSGACTTGSIGDGLPLANDVNSLLEESKCTYGNVFVEGQVDGRLTISAENNVVITDDLTYTGGQNGDDALGLIAGNSVKIHHPVQRTCTTNNSSCWSNLASPNTSDVVVYAAILTLQHSFGVQMYHVGAKLGALKLHGSIAQRFRGPVGTSGGTGYLKDYNYDSRLRYSPPPYFLDPVRASWGQKTFGEVQGLYKS